MALGKLNVHKPKKDVGPLPYIIYKTSFKMHRRLKCKAKAVRFLDKNPGE